MTHRPRRRRPPHPRHRTLHTNCSLLVLAGVGALGLTSAAFAQSTGGALAAGTLPVLKGIVSGQAVFNASAPGAPRPLLTIDQTTQRAIFDWKSFNISGDAEVLFRQPGSTASALNRIYDANPTVIQGRLSTQGPVVDGQPTAGGQIILINQNGILFDRGSQVNAQSLVASTLNLSNSRFLSGALTTGGLTSPAFEGGYDSDTPSTASGPGAIRIGGGPSDAPAPRIRANAGGSVLLFAPRIDNAGGLITAPDGQVILAAGSKVFLALNEDAANTTLRGLRVEIEADRSGPDVNLTSLIRNAGEISADRGNVTLAALAVNQDGRVSARTAVQANGSIYLKARTADASGTVSLGSGSATEVLPDAGDTATLPNSADYAPLRGAIEIDARLIDSRGAIRAPGGRIALRAEDAQGGGAARVYLDAGSETSVAGAWADLPFSSTLLTFRVTSNELRNSPDQRNGVLRGSEVTVDLRRGSEILDLSGYIGAQARTVTEKAGLGGELTISSTGSVVQRPGATLDASGGGYRYGAGTANTTRLLGDDGRIYDIATAPKDRVYTGLLDRVTRVDPRWGQTTTYANPLGSLGTPEPGFVQGLPGGSITIRSASGLVLDGSLLGGATIGRGQFTSAPRGASLTLGIFNPDQPEASVPIGAVRFASSPSDSLGSAFTPTADLPGGELTLATRSIFGPSRTTAEAIEETAFSTVAINSNSSIVLPQDVRVEAPAGASLSLRAPNVDLAGDVCLPAGQLIVPSSPLAPLIPADVGAPQTTLTVRSSADISTAGAWINASGPGGSFIGGAAASARVPFAGGSATPTTSGGSISLTAQSMVLEDGAVLDVSAGAALDRNGRISGGGGGSLTLANGISSASSSDWMQATLKGYGVTASGQLNITTPQIVVDREDANGALASRTTRLLPALFSELGFGSVSLSAPMGLLIAAGTEIRPQQKNLLVDPVAARALPTGGDLAGVASLTTRPDASRAPVNVALNATSTTTGLATVAMEEGASIVADPAARISISGVDGVRVDGKVAAPGGTIALTLNGIANSTAPALTLGPRATLSTAGTFVPSVNDQGLVQGAVVGGGTVTIEAVNTSVALRAGSHIDVSGVRREVDVAGDGGGAPSTRRPVDGPAGAVIVKSQGSVALDGTMRGDRPSTTSAGGSFALELVAPNETPARPLVRRIIATPFAIEQGPETGFVDAPVAINPLIAGGFDKIRLQAEDRIEFRGDTRLTFDRGIRLDAPLLNILGNGTVRLEGATVSLGQSLGPRASAGGGFFISQLDATPVVPTRAGAGSLLVSAQNADLFGSLTVNGVEQVSIQAAQDVRLIGRAVQSTIANADGARPIGQIGTLTTTGDVRIEAAQVYPSTRTSFAIAVKDTASGVVVPGGQVVLAKGSGTPGDVYSAGGKVSIEADSIRQAGRLQAPLGEIELKAGSRLELASGSVTSAGANGLTVPYGTTDAGVVWTYVDGGAVSQASAVTNISEAGKRVSLSGPTIDIGTGAVVDVSGGGDVQATEFVPGTGGDSDVTLRPNTFAIIPKSRLTGRPVDADIAARQDIGFGFGSARQDTALYDSIEIGAGGGVPAGEYALLPARYALLPDAFLVQIQSGAAYRNLGIGDTVALNNGGVVVAGFRTASSTSVRESQSVGVLVRPGSAALQESDFTLTRSQFLADAATRERLTPPPLPHDAGRIGIERASMLTLGGTFRTQAATASDGDVGNVAQFDISGPRVAIVDRIGSSAVANDFLQIDAASLSALNGSVLLGGVRSTTAAGTSLSTEASTVVVANTAQSEVRLPELLLTANDRIDIRPGAALRAAGRGAEAEPAPTTLLAGSSGALVRLSSLGQASVSRGPTPDGSKGEVSVGTGATLVADGAILVDATKTVSSRGSFRTGPTGGSVSLASARLTLGDVTDVTDPDSGLLLSNADLASYGALDNLTLKGYRSIDLSGATVVGSPGLASLVLDAPAVRGLGGTFASTVDAKTVALRNTTGPASQGNGQGTGSLTVRADRVELGAGDKSVTGFADVRVRAQGEVVGQDTGTLNVAGDWTIQAQRLRGDPGSNQTWSARDPSATGPASFRNLTVGSSATALQLPADVALGARLSLEGQRVAVDTTVQALSGSISIAARGDRPGDDVAIGPNGRIVAAGAVKDFNGATAIAGGGSIALAAGMAAGKVDLASGSVLDVSAGAVEGDAGSFRVAAAGVRAAGELKGASAEGRSGIADLDLGTFASVGEFSTLNDRLNAGGFAESRTLRLRSGDIAVAAADRVSSRDVILSADAGAVAVAGTVGRGTSDRGARVELYGGQGVTLAAGSRVDAGARGTDADGGDVRIATRNGSLHFDPAASIDVSNDMNGRTGSVTFTVPRDASNAVGSHTLAGTVFSKRSSAGGAADVAVEAQRTYQVGTSVSATDIALYGSQHQSFIGGAPSAALGGALKGDDGGSAGAVLRGATELQAFGDLRVDPAWNLASAAFLAGGQPGTLTLRAAGNLTLSNSIGLPSDNILAGGSWNLRFAAGADLGAANPSAVLSQDRLAVGKGDLLLTGANARLRTGTGDIELAAGRDVRIDNVRGAVYTGGRIGAPDTEPQGNNRWAVDGGDIRVTAGRDVAGPVNPTGDLWITDWFRRTRTSQADFVSLQRTDWWAYRPNFQQGIGALAGGDVDVAAGRDVSNLSAMLPTTGRTIRDAAGARQVDVQGGGDLRLAAGNDVIGGAYLVGRGEGRIDAGGNVGQQRAIQLYVMGASSGSVPAQSDIRVSAGNDLRLQSVNNPTVLAQFNTPNATGPSFTTPGSSVVGVFTYSPNSSVSLKSEGGDVSLEPYISTQARSLGNANIGAVQRTSGDVLPAFPANLDVTAFDGSVVRQRSTLPLVTFPSPTAAVRILADDSIASLRLTGSDRAPATVSTPTTVQPGTLVSSNNVAGGNALLTNGLQARILDRAVDAPFVFDIQALTGSITDAGLTLPAVSRVRAGQDVLRSGFTLQNLSESDQSLIRADAGDIRAPVGIEIRGPGDLLLQAGRNVDLGRASVRLGDAFPGGLLATGSNSNPNLRSASSARIAVVAGVVADVDLRKLEAAYTEIIALNSASTLGQDFYTQLANEADNGPILGSSSIAELAARNNAYQRFVSLDKDAPRLLSAYQNALRARTLPLGDSADATAARALYALLNTEADTQKLVGAGGIPALAAQSPAYTAFVDLDTRFPRLFTDYLQRRSAGARPTAITSIVFSDALAEVVADVVKPQDVRPGSISSFRTSIQTFGGSDVDLIAPGGEIVVGLTTPAVGNTIGVLTNAGGSIRSLAAGNFDVNQGKVLTAQGGDILIFSAQGSIDAGRGARTSLSTPPPTRTPVLTTVEGQSVIVGYLYTLPTSASGSGIQTLTSDPDGAGPRLAPGAGSVFLFAPAGTIDAGEAGIRSGGNVVLNAQTVLNATNITASGTSVGVPLAVTGSLAATVASSGTTTPTSTQGSETERAASTAARAAAAETMRRPTILVVEVLGFGDRNCREQDRDCFAK